jgi:hypothetical protein
MYCPCNTVNIDIVIDNEEEYITGDMLISVTEIPGIIIIPIETTNVRRSTIILMPSRDRSQTPL